MARTLGGYLSGQAIEVFHARDLDLHDKPDVEWISHVASTADDWLVFTGDGRIRKNRAEREAYRRARLKGVVLAPSYQKTPMGKCCGMVVINWDSLVDFTNKIVPPYLVELSMNQTKKYKLLPL